jgi:hypothetical protein
MVRGSMQYTWIETLSAIFIREKPNETSKPYFKDKIENFDDFYPCTRNECNLFHVHNWNQFFVSMYNDTTLEIYFINELNIRGDRS